MWASLRKGSEEEDATRGETVQRSSMRDMRRGESEAAAPVVNVPVYRPGGVYGDEEGAGDAHWKPFVVTQREKFKEWAHVDSHVDLIGQQETLRGYRVYVVEQWMHSLARPQCTIVHHTGDVKEAICVSIVKPDSFTTSKQTNFLTEYFYKPTTAELYARETHLGVLVCASDAFFPVHNIVGVVSGSHAEPEVKHNSSATALRLIPILDGNVDAHLKSIELDLTLRKLGCRAEGTPVDLNGPSHDVATTFFRAFPAMQGTPITDAVPQLVRQVKVMLDAIGLIMPPAKVDDVYDARLVGSVRSFQRMHNGHQGVRDESVPHERLPENGLCNAATLNALRARMLLFVGMLFSAGHPFLGDPVLNYDDFKMTVMKFQKTARGLANGKLDNRTTKRLSSALNSTYCGEYRVRILDLAGARLSLSGHGTVLHVHAKAGTCVLRGADAPEMATWHDAVSSTIELLAKTSTPPQEHVMCGVLHKQSSAIFREWSKRFVVLVGGHLVYWYHPIPKVADGSKKKKKKGFLGGGGGAAEEAEEGLRCEHDEIGVITLAETSSVCESSRTDEGATLDLFDGDTMHLLAFPTTDERDAWLAALSDASAHRRATRKCGLSLRFCGKIPRWRRRYLVLVDRTLCYFRVEDAMTQLPTSLHSHAPSSPSTARGRETPSSLLRSSSGALAHRSIVNRLDHTLEVRSDGESVGSDAEIEHGADAPTHKSRVRFIDPDGGAIVGTHGSAPSLTTSSASSALSIHVLSDSDSRSSDSDDDDTDDDGDGRESDGDKRVPATQVGELAEANAELRARCAALEALVGAQAGEIGALRDECATLEQSLATQAARQSVLETSVSSLRSALERMERKDSLQSQRVQGLDRRLLENVQSQNVLRRRVEKIEEHGAAKEESLLSGLAMNASSLALAGAFNVAWAVTSVLDVGRQVGESVGRVMGIDSDSEDDESEDESEGEADGDVYEDAEGEGEASDAMREGTQGGDGGDARGLAGEVDEAARAAGEAASSDGHDAVATPDEGGGSSGWFSVPWRRRQRAPSAASSASDDGASDRAASVTPPNVLRGAPRMVEAASDSDTAEPRSRASSAASSRASSRAASPTTLHSRFVASSSASPPHGGSGGGGGAGSSSSAPTSRRSTRRKDAFFSSSLSGSSGLEGRLKMKRR